MLAPSRWPLVVCGLVLVAAPSFAQEEGAELPLTKLVMFSSGVGFFEHRGEVEGNADVELTFNVDDVNDLLKSMVLQDLGGGKISTVSYESRDPITKTLQTFAIDLTNNPTLAELLGQIRGERVSLDAPTEIVGTILGVEKRQEKAGDNVIEVAYLNLLTDEGLRSVPLASVGRIKLESAALDAELRQALTILAMGHATDKKTVTLQFLGEGERPVRVGYIQESPIWKTSYRLVLSDEESPFLQGWAIVENTTEEDWQDVDLTLVSGRPISFVMDLYQPLYVARPVVEPELFASLRPQTYGQDMDGAEAEFRKLAEVEQLQERARSAAPPAPSAAFGLAAGRGAGAAGDRAYSEQMDLQQGVQSMAQAGDVGELFRYQIETPVTLRRQQSAMLPIVNAAVEGEKVSIYNQNVQAKHPLNGLKLKNTTELHLMQGPITVFDDGAYAGDAQIEDLQPGTERLISYALDLDTEVAPETKASPEQLVSVKLIKGTLHTSHKYQRAVHYTVKNSGRRAKNVLIEYPVDPAWTLIAPEKPAETTRDLYRFAVAAEPGEPAKLVVEEEMINFQQIALNNLDDGTIQFYINQRVVSEAVKEALAEVIRRKQALQTLAASRAQLEQEIGVISQEQARIRENMAQLDRNTDLYNRYVKKFGEQEDKVENLREQIAGLIDEETKARQALDEYLLGLNL